MNTSVIMVSNHTGKMLFISVANVLKQQAVAELILLDGGNTPDVMARLQQLSLVDTRLKIIKNYENNGYAASCNRGAAFATSEFLLFLKPEFFLPIGAVVEISSQMNSMVGTMVAGPLLVNASGTIHADANLVTPTPANILWHALSLRKKALPQTEAAYDAGAVSGACMMVRKRDFEAVQGFDVAYDAVAEDVDFCKRVNDAGGRIIIVPKIRVADAGNTASISARNHAKSLSHYLEKHHAQSSFPGVVPMLQRLIKLACSIKSIRFFNSKNVSETEQDARKKLLVLSQALMSHEPLPALAGKTVIVTGATNQVGLFVVKRLLAAGVAVIIISREPPLPFWHENLLWLQNDLADEHFSLKGYLADMIVHCAPVWLLPNILPQLGAAEVKRVVAISSTSTFSKAMSKNKIEMALVKKYSQAELDIAKICAENHMQWTILRPTITYGAGLDKSIYAIAKTLKKYGAYFLYPPAVGRRQPVHADDVALAALNVANNPQCFSKSYNISGGEIVKMRTMVERIAATLKIKARITQTTLLPLVMQLAGKLTRNPHWSSETAHQMNDDLVFFHDDATRDFGFQPRAFLSGGIRDIEGEIWHE